VSRTCKISYSEEGLKHGFKRKYVRHHQATFIDVTTGRPMLANSGLCVHTACCVR
jgi:hypothetical protein